MSSLMITRFCSMRLLPTLSLFHSMKWPTRTSVSLLIHLVLILLLLLKLTCGVYCQINEKVYVPLCLWTVSVEYWFILTFSLVSFAEACCFKGIRETLKALVSLCISIYTQFENLKSFSRKKRCRWTIVETNGLKVHSSFNAEINQFMCCLLIWLRIVLDDIVLAF